MQHRVRYAAGETITAQCRCCPWQTR